MEEKGRYGNFMSTEKVCYVASYTPQETSPGDTTKTTEMKK
jgi:hypothetical protein